MEKISINNFGPILNAEVLIRDINIFIGTTSSGKSTVAKLISLFKGIASKPDIKYPQFNKLLADYNIDFSIARNTLIRYQKDNFSIEIVHQSFSYTSPPAFIAVNPIYIPAERMFFSTISQSIFGLINSNVSLPKWLIDFGAKFEQARNSIKKISIPFLDVDYEYSDGTDYVQLANNISIKLSQASSGLQSVIPLLLVIQFNTETDKGIEDIFVIEEPELNLYPSSQKDLIEFIIRRINHSQNDKLIITTHSPYLLTAIDNLIQAKNIAKSIPANKEKINGLVSSACWIDYERVSCYYFDKGTCRSTLDEEMQSIGPSNIDDVSTTLSDTFEQLLALKYPA